jgi:hypothetical protein
MPPLKLTPDILEKADAAQLRIIYEGFIEILMAVTKEEMITANKEILAQTITYPELHDGGSIPEVVFFYYLKTLMETVGIQDFTLRDLFEPQFPRTKRFLSAIINFAKFREERLSRYNELAGPTSDESLIRQHLHLCCFRQGLSFHSFVCFFGVDKNSLQTERQLPRRNPT